MQQSASAEPGADPKQDEDDYPEQQPATGAPPKRRRGPPVRKSQSRVLGD